MVQGAPPGHQGLRLVLRPVLYYRTHFFRYCFRLIATAVCWSVVMVWGGVALLRATIAALCAALLHLIWDCANAARFWGVGGLRVLGAKLLNVRPMEGLRLLTQQGGYRLLGAAVGGGSLDWTWRTHFMNDCLITTTDGEPFVEFTCTHIKTETYKESSVMSCT